jgi:hypothetical protein
MRGIVAGADGGGNLCARPQWEGERPEIHGQDRIARLDQARLEAVVLPGVPAALAKRWSKATQDRHLTPQDHLRLTLHLTNVGQHDVEELAADLSFLPDIQGLYP